MASMDAAEANRNAEAEYLAARQSLADAERELTRVHLWLIERQRRVRAAERRLRRPVQPTCKLSTRPAASAPAQR